ncbi:calcium uniporter protein, mitochondrial-like [Dreissena polymorpha]|uniref:calcium uniporter protein, mitochondrial-like n=1 Tax=Dreissena polymorpha TaxID=45954 RepID=UPI00226541D1|nr:calcium uniporter protein, mitochondrial-like [Dreissena polymorpha]
MATSGMRSVVRKGVNHFIGKQKPFVFIQSIQLSSLPNQLTFCPCVAFSSSAVLHSDVSVKYRHGLSVFAVPLPSRKESCEIVLKPVSHTVKDLVNFIKEEDKGIDRVAVYRANEVKVAGSTTIDILLRSPFTLTINEDTFNISPPEPEVTLPSETFERLTEVKSLTAKLYSQLNVEEYQLKRERDLIQQIEEYRLQIQPYLTMSGSCTSSQSQKD